MVGQEGESLNTLAGRKGSPATVRRPVGADERSEVSVRQKMVGDTGLEPVTPAM